MRAMTDEQHEKVYGDKRTTCRQRDMIYLTFHK